MIIYKSTNAIFTVFNGTISLIYVRKFRAKKFLEKNLEIKTLEKSVNFLKSLEKMSLEIKSSVLDSWDFFFLKKSPRI